MAKLNNVLVSAFYFVKYRPGYCLQQSCPNTFPEQPKPKINSLQD
jgi:hypothetical protein